MRGRGRGRGRGGGNRRRHGHRGNRSQVDCDSTTPNDTKPEIKFGSNMSGFFTGSSTFEQHLEAQETEYDRYVAAIAVLMENGVTLSNSAKINILAVAWARHDHELANTLLDKRDQFKVNEVFKAMTLLDSGRMTRVWEKKMKILELQSHKPKAKTLMKIKKNINNTAAQKTKIGSASGALCRHMKRWVRKFTADELEFFALHFPVDLWKKFADICHFNPKQDFPNLPWFLPYCFGEPAPEGTIVAHCKHANADNVNELIQSYDIPYLHVKNFKDKLTVESKCRIATYTKSVNTLLWYYEDLKCDEVDVIINSRLEAGEAVSLTYGKLVERILAIKIMQKSEITRGHFVKHLMPQATVTNIKLTLEAPVVVIGDMSPSMNVAIRTSTIIASLLTAVSKAQLVFFNDENHDAPFVPKDIEQVIKLAMTTEACGCGTAPAASLLPFYTRKEVVKTFVIVTDEEENTPATNNMTFAELFKHYHDEIYPARLVFVSFLQHQASEGQMVSSLKAEGFSPLQFKFDGHLPDLTKLDNLLGQLSTNSQSFEDQVNEKEKMISDGGLSKIFEGLEVKNQRI